MSFDVFFRTLLGVFYPFNCANCRGALPLSAEYPVCGPCGSKISIHEGPCGAEVVPGWDRALYACRYEGIARKLIQKFKIGRKLSLGRFFNRLLGDLADREHLVLADFEAIVPVPPHKGTRRAFSAAREMGMLFSQKSGIELRDILVPVRSMRKQSLLGRQERIENVREAFRASERVPKNILLLDDVLTTGATADACARALKVAGARTVCVVAIARGYPESPS